MWLECCRTEKGDNSGVGTFYVEGPAHVGQEWGARRTYGSACEGGQRAVCSVRRAGGPQRFQETSWVWGCRVGGEEEWGNPMAVSQAASHPHFSKEQRERRVLGLFRVGGSAEPAQCGSAASPRCLPPPPILQPAKLVPRRHSNPPASCASGGGGVGGLAAHWCGGEQQCGWTGRWPPTTLLQGPRDHLRLGDSLWHE